MDGNRREGRAEEQIWVVQERCRESFNWHDPVKMDPAALLLSPSVLTLGPTLRLSLPLSRCAFGHGWRSTRPTPWSTSFEPCWLSNTPPKKLPLTSAGIHRLAILKLLLILTYIWENKIILMISLYVVRCHISYIWYTHNGS